MHTQKLSKQRIAAAFVVAVIADAIQFPITAATMTGVLAVPGEGFELRQLNAAAATGDCAVALCVEVEVAVGGFVRDPGSVEVVS